MPAEARKKSTTEIPAVQHVTEADDHFIVTFTDGQSTTVAKEGLKDDTIAHIQGMAHGGEVRGLAGSGGTVDPSGEGSELAPGVLPEDVQFPGKTGQVEPVLKGPKPEEARPVGEEIPSYADGGMVDAGSAQSQFLPYPAMPDAGTMPGFVPIDIPAPGLQPPSPIFESIRPGALEASAAITKDAPYAKPGQGMVKGPPPGPELVPPLTRPAQAPTAQPEQQFRLPSFGGSGALAELNKGLEEQRAGLRAQVAAEEAKDAALLQMQDAHIARMQALEAQHAEQRELLQRRADDLFVAVQNGRVDPNRVWANADLGQRIGAGIGILLSGIGQGLSGGPNLALLQIDKTIDRDIAAQRDNLETQKGLLSHYLQQGRDMLSAHALAKADLKDLLSAQLLRVSTQFGGQEAAARAQLLGGQLRTEAAGKRQEILARDFQMASQRAAMAMEMERNRMLSAFTGAMRQPGALPAEAWEVLPKDMRERRVRVPDGSWRLAKDAGQATKIQEGLEKVDEFKQVLGRYSQLLQTGSPRLLTGLGGDATAAQQLRATLQALLKEAEALGAMSKGDYEFIDKQIPDISEWFTRKGTKEQGLSALGSTVDARVAAKLKTLGQL